MATRIEEKQVKNDTKKREVEEKTERKRNKIKQIMNQGMNSIGFVILMGILVFAKTFLFYNSTIAATENLAVETILGTFSFLVVLVCFLCVLPNRARIMGGIVMNILLSGLLFGDAVYYSYSNNVLSVAQISNLQYGEEIISTLPRVLEIKQIFYFLDIIVLAILRGMKWLKMEKKDKKTKRQLTAKWITGIIGLTIFCIISVKFVEKGKDKIYNKDLQIRESTIFGYHIGDIKNTINIKSQTKYKEAKDMMVDYKKLKKEYQERYGEERYNRKGSLANKNIIIIQLESIQEFVINKQINGKPITPNLNRFLEENIEFTNMHMQSYSTTADSEHSTITSIYPMENGMSFSKYYTNTYDDLFKMFQQANYYTSYMHGNDAYFWNRQNVYTKLGVKDLALKDKFRDTEYINGFLSDEVFYTQAIEKMKQYPGPFISFLVSASSHTPYELEGLQDRSKIHIDVGQYKNTYFGNYLEAVNYADYAFGVLLDKLKEEGRYEETGILVFGDHNGMNLHNEEMIEFLQSTNPNLNDVEIQLNYTRVVCGMKIPGMDPITIEKPVSKLDIKPTLTYLVGVEDGFSLGTNLLASKEFVALNNERIIANEYYYDENWYEIESGNQVNSETIQEETKELLEQYYQFMKTELEISNSVSVNNLLEHRGL